MKFKVGSFLLTLLLLTACVGGAKAPTVIPTVILGSTVSTPAPSLIAGGDVTASGFVVTDQVARMAFKLAGNVTLVQVKDGDHVQAGQVLVQLDDTLQQIQLDQATLSLDELTSAAAIAAAQQAVAQDQQDLDNAQANLNNQLYYSTNKDAIQNAQANLTLANNNLSNAQKAYNNVTGDPNTDAGKAYAYQQLYTAQQAYDSALYNYNWWSGKPNQEQVDLKTALLALAKAKLAEDQTLVTFLTGGSPIPDNATGAGIVQLRQAQLNVRTAQYNLDATRLVAPFSGEVGSVATSIGDFVSPGQVILVISDVSQMHIETTDLSERDVPKVKLGQTVTVSIKALNQNVAGKVTAISPLSATLGGDVVYNVTIALDELPSNLRAGMSVDVQIHSEP